MFDYIFFFDGSVTSCCIGDLHFNVVWFDDDEFDLTGFCIWAMMDDEGKFYDHGEYKAF